MKAVTHTEVYRPFEGQLVGHAMVFWVIAQSALRQALKSKLVLLFLYAPVAIGCVIASFRVHFMFTLAAGGLAPNSDPGAIAMGQMLAGLLGDVVDNIFIYLNGTAFFMLLAVTWYGAGMIAEDRRLGAHQLYFSRPLTRLQYLLGKLCAVSVFGALALTLPCSIVCSVACFSSPDWTFLTGEWDTILKVLGFTLAWIMTLALIVLAVSSVAGRKVHALLGVTCLVVACDGGSRVLAGLLDDSRFTLFSLYENFERLGEAIFQRWNPSRQVSLEATLWALAAIWVLSLFVLSERVRKMEVVA